MTTSRDQLQLTIGPLHYEFRARDAWGECELARLRNHVECRPFPGAADHLFHLYACDLTCTDLTAISAGLLPERLATLLPADAPRHGWVPTGDWTGHVTWRHPVWRDSLWTHTVQPGDCEAPFQLPWPLLLADIVTRGGGILHGGMASREGRGYLFLAPPGGGKTTALACIAPPWQVWADDAVLVWPTGAGAFLASPLPTWSVLLGRSTALPAIQRWRLAAAVPIAGLLFLEKSAVDDIFSLAPIDVAPRLYRALCEYPSVLANRLPFRQEFFHVAAALARAAPAWKLALTREGRYWEMLETHIN